ncbi:MAG: acyltransferase family protein [Sulfurifustaceae bacterium]
MALPDANKNYDIELLRGVAVLFVAIHHVRELFTWDGRWQALFLVTTFWGGVDLFFCISGYVIARSLLRRNAADSFIDFALPFWIRRASRIWPAAVFWVMLAILASLLFNRTGAFGPFKANLIDGVAAVTQVANFHFLGCWSYHHGLCGNEGIYWSLSLEEQFYVVLPFALFFLPRQWLLAGLIAAIGAQAFLERPMGSLGWMLRTDAICYGVLIAFAAEAKLQEKLPIGLLRSKPRAFALSLGLILLMALIPTGNVVWFDTGLLAVVCAILVLIASYDARLILPAPLLGPVLAWIGSRSYAIYLTHTFSYWLTREVFYRAFPDRTFDAHFTLPFVLVAAIFIVSFSEASYRWIEKPLRERGREIAAHYRAASPPLQTEATTPEASAGALTLETPRPLAPG